MSESSIQPQQAAPETKPAPTRPKPKGLVMGFFTVLQDGPSGWIAGYLLTNVQGRPLEFRLTSPVQPTKVQQILYGPTLESYIVGELMGKNLAEKASYLADLIITDVPIGLEVRRHLEVPALLVGAGGLPVEIIGRPGWSVHNQFPGDGDLIRSHLETVDSRIDLIEPFARIKEAIQETRRMSVGTRSVA